MRSIKFIGDVTVTKLEGIANNLSVAELVEILSAKNITLDISKNMLTDKATKATFLTNDAMLPDGDIVLFSTIKDPKGNLSRQECYEFIRNCEDPDFFCKDRNYTNKSTVALVTLIDEYKVRIAQNFNSTAQASNNKFVEGQHVLVPGVIFDVLGDGNYCVELINSDCVDINEEDLMIGTPVEEVDQDLLDVQRLRAEQKSSLYAR